MIVVMMGVSGSGKTTIGSLVAERLNWKFYDADNFHPQSNIDKMRSGVPLTDDDRAPWLDALCELLKNCERKSESCVLACSALREYFRLELHRAASGHIKFVLLSGSKEVLHDRLLRRTQHYMKSSMLDSQLEIFEEPSDALHLDISRAPQALVDEIVMQVQL